jgi:hypothetical protein
VARSCSLSSARRDSAAARNAALACIVRASQGTHDELWEGGHA